MFFRSSIDKGSLGKKMTPEARDMEAETLLRECLEVPEKGYKTNGRKIARHALAELLIEGTRRKNLTQEENKLFIDNSLKELPTHYSLRLQQSLSLQKLKEQPESDPKSYEEALCHAHEEEIRQGEESDLTQCLMKFSKKQEYDPSSSHDDEASQSDHSDSSSESPFSSEKSEEVGHPNQDRLEKKENA